MRQEHQARFEGGRVRRRHYARRGPAEQAFRLKSKAAHERTCSEGNGAIVCRFQQQISASEGEGKKPLPVVAQTRVRLPLFL